MGRLDRMVKGMAALLVSGLAGAIIGMVTGAIVGLPFFGIGAIFGGGAGAFAGVPTGMLGATFRTRTGWVWAGALGAALGGCSLLYTFGGKDWIERGYQTPEAAGLLWGGLLIGLPAIAGAFAGWRVALGLEKGSGIFAPWRNALDGLGWFEQNVAERVGSLAFLIFAAVGIWQLLVALYFILPR